jgi:hypothetical protein
MNKFFTFNQNNSGGEFDIDLESGISEYVIIEAATASEANDRAEEIGLYFDGCNNEMDCECCGDRWSRAWEDELGDDTPMIYGEDVFTVKKVFFGGIVFIHYLDGKIEKVVLK